MQEKILGMVDDRKKSSMKRKYEVEPGTEAKRIKQVKFDVLFATIFRILRPVIICWYQDELGSPHFHDVPQKKYW